MEHKFNYKWDLSDLGNIEQNGLKVFSCFACGGGSSMGYKLAGYDVIGCNEIDPRMNEVYVKNLTPKFNYLEPIQEFKLRKDLPEELYNLDILDGSPPCSNFSMAGNREKDWGKEKKFREGQVLQVLDTLFFDFIDLAKELQPKVVIAENVKGLLQGEAKEYCKKIYDEFELAGYKVQHFLLDASKMGVPQRRERVFFIAIRNDIAKDMPSDDMFSFAPSLRMDFNGEGIKFSEFYQNGKKDRKVSSGKMKEYWDKRIPSDKSFSDIMHREYGKVSCFNNGLLHLDVVCPTYTSNGDCFYLYDEYRKPNKYESCCIFSFPQDYDFINSQYHYVLGMSVPPIMIAQIAIRIREQVLERK